MKLTLVFLVVAAVLGASAAEEETSPPEKLNLKQHFNDLIEELKQIGKSALANAAQQALAAGKATLMELLVKLEMEHVMNEIGKRSLKDDVFAKAAETMKRLETLVNENTEKATAGYEKAMDRLKEIVAKIHESDVYKNAESKLREIKLQIDDAIRTHSLGIRDVENSFSANGKVGEKIADFFKPHIEKVKGHINKLGDLAKEHATNVHEAAKAHLDDLAGKMVEHGKTLIGHGQTAVDQLKEAVTDILNETFKNMAGTIKDAINTGKDSIDTIHGHITESIQA